MELKNLLEKIRREKINNAYVFYKDEEGIKNICYQDGTFFFIVDKENRKIRYCNPIVAAETLKNIEKGNIQLVGKGIYGEPINFKKDYKFMKKRG